MRFAKATATLAFLLAVTGTFAAPLPRQSQGEEDVEISHPHHAHGHHHHHRHRVSLAKWIHAHLHYPHRWPFHPHHNNQSHLQHGVEENETPKKSGSMLRFWLHSHFAPHTSKLRTHRGKAIPDSNQKVLSSSFDDKPPSDEDGLKARDFETHSTPESEDDGSHEPHRNLKGLHKAGYELHKMVEEMGNVHDTVEKLHLRVGMAAAKLGHKGKKESGREIDELD